jgi:cytochrome c oxidase cbb3-type subunit III
MRWTKGLAGACLFFLCITPVLAGRQRGGPAQGNRGRGAAAPTNFPAQQRVPGDPAIIARGNALYGIHCRSCHGADLRGGEQGGPNLLRSETALKDQAGELYLPVIQQGRQNPGLPPMPAIPLSVDDVKAVSEYIHSVLATAQRQGGPPPAPPVTLNILVGDASAGKAYFDSRCGSCHSAAGDLKGIATRVASPMQLQNLWVGGPGGRGANATPVMATVTLPSGQKVEGRLGRVDDFLVILQFEDGTSRSFRREGNVPKVEIRDPRAAHRQLLPTYTDKDIHDVTAYLVTLK